MDPYSSLPGRDSSDPPRPTPVGVLPLDADRSMRGLSGVWAHRDGRGMVGFVAALTFFAAVVASLAAGGLVAWLNAGTQPSVPAWAHARPAIPDDFPDPAMLVVGNVYYAYATNAHGKHIQVARSGDLRTWTMLPDALPILPVWADAGGSWVWAPAVMRVGQRYMMYYTARDTTAGRQCIGVATSLAPGGPFTDASARPLVCQASQGGSIDPTPFRDGDALYLYFKSDGNCCGLQTHIWGQRLTPDGLALLGSPTLLLSNDKAWEGAVIEAPDMVAHDGQYDLFYSANDYASERYAIGYARCLSPLGPCVKSTGAPLLASAPGSPETLAGPGGESIFQATGSTWIAFHAWKLGSDGSAGPSRCLLIERLGWRGDTPLAPNPDTGR